MDSFLSELNEEGALDSEGVFTLNASKAQLKLAKYQVQLFQSFVRFFVAAAVTSGTINLRATVSRRSLTNPQPYTNLEFIGWSPSESELTALGHQGVAQGRAKALQYLAIALSTLNTKYPVRAQSGTTAILLENQNMTIGPSSINLKHLRVRVDADLGEILESRFRKLTRWNRLELTLDGRTFPSGIHSIKGWPSALGLYWLPGPEQLPVVLSPTHQQNTVIDSERATYPQILAFTKPSEAKRFGFHVVIDGLPFPAADDLDLPHICGAVVADHLDVDISHSGIRKSEDYLAVLNQVRASVTIMLEAILKLKCPLNSEQELCFHQLLSRLSQDFEVTHLSSLLHQHLSRMQPCYGIKEVASLRLRIPQTSQEEQDALFQGYRQVVTQLRMSGKVAEASWHLKAEIELREAVGRDTEQQNLLLGLFELSQLARSKNSHSSSLLSEFVHQLSQWTADGTFELSFANREVIHSSWYLPFVLATNFELKRWDTVDKLLNGKLPAWTKVLKMLEHQKAEEALELASDLPELFFLETKVYWQRLLWAHFRGKLSLATLMGIRVKLTRVALESGKNDVWTRLNRAFGGARSSSHAEFKIEAATTLRKDFFSKRFWPKFLHLWFYAEDWPAERRSLMAGLMAQLLLGKLLVSETSDPLTQPVDWLWVGSY